MELEFKFNAKYYYINKIVFDSNEIDFSTENRVRILKSNDEKILVSSIRDNWISLFIFPTESPHDKRCQVSPSLDALNDKLNN